MKTILLAGILLLSTTFAKAQHRDAVLGHWRSAHGSGKMLIFKKGDKYFGKLIWLKEPLDERGHPKKDIHNPDAKPRSRSIIGLEVLKDLKYKNDGIYTGGSIYNPKTGNSYNCQMKLYGPDRLDIRGYFGLSLIGKTETWIRVP